MDHISGCSQVYLSRRGGDELFEGLKAQITQKKVTLFPALPFRTAASIPRFLFMALHLARSPWMLETFNSMGN